MDRDGDTRFVPNNSGEDEQFLKKIALGRLITRPKTVLASAFDPTKLEMGCRIKPLKHPNVISKRPIVVSFATQIAQELLRVETFRRTFLQRSEHGGVKRVVCVKFRVEQNCLYYGAGTWNNAEEYMNGEKYMVESKVKETQVKLMETATCRYARFPVQVRIPYQSKLTFDRWLFKAIRKNGTCAKIVGPNMLVWK